MVTVTRLLPSGHFVLVIVVRVTPSLVTLVLEVRVRLLIFVPTMRNRKMDPGNVGILLLVCTIGRPNATKQKQ